MSLSDFYSTAMARGFSRDYQVRVEDIIIRGVSINEMAAGEKEALNYVKSVSLPSRKVGVNNITYNTVQIPISTGISDFGEKDNYQITFWADQGLDFRNWFNNRIEPAIMSDDDSILAPNILDKNIIQISILDDTLEPVLAFKLQGVTIKEVGGIKYNKEGSGKPQEFTVTFTYYRMVPSEGIVTGRTGQTGAPPQQGGILGFLQSVTQTAKAVTGTARAIGGASTAIRGAARSIRG